MAAGPSIADMMANLGCFYGLVNSLANEETPPESVIPFAVARENFYATARYGLDANIVWLDGQSIGLREVIPGAAKGLARLGVNEDLASRYLETIEPRTHSGRTGAQWQRQFAATTDRDWALLIREYAARQKTGAPVHTWEI